VKYLFMFGMSDPDWSAVPAETTAAIDQQCMAWWREHAQAGRLLHGAKLQAPTAATTVRVADDKHVVTDGPFVEAKEILGGYALMELPDLDEAIAVAKTWPPLVIAGESVEIRPVDEM
jgi:hypothetical protein